MQWFFKSSSKLVNNPKYVFIAGADAGFQKS